MFKIHKKGLEPMKFKKTIIVLLLLIVITGIFIIRRKEEGVEVETTFKSGKGVTIAITSDLHFLSNSINDRGKAFEEFYKSGDGKILPYINEITDTLIYELEESKPDILILSGDLTSNGELVSHKEVSEKLKTVEKNGTKVYVIPGNHDIENPHARGFKGEDQYKVDSISAKVFEETYNDFGYSEAISKDKNSLSYLAAPTDELWVLMIDTNQYENNKKLNYPEIDGEIKTETYQWIKDALEDAKKKGIRVLPIMHHNIVDHNELINKGFTMNNNEKLLKLLMDYNVKLSLTGHIHIQDIKKVSENNKELYEIASNSLAVYPNEYGILKYSSENGYNYSTKELNVEEFAASKGIANKDLIGFENYSKEFFDNIASRNYIRLVLDKGYSEEKSKDLIDFIVKLNSYYFSGRVNEIEEELKNSNGYLLWQEEKGFVKEYIKVIFNNCKRDNNNISIQ